MARPRRGPGVRAPARNGLPRDVQRRQRRRWRVPSERHPLAVAARCRPLRQESCPLGLTHPPGGPTDDHENDLWPRCAGASPTANEPTNRKSVAEIARSTGIAVPTLYSWRHRRQQEGLLVPASSEAPEPSSAADKLAAVIQAAALRGTDLGSFCRERGLYPKQFTQWCQIAEDANGPSAPNMADQRQLQRKNQELTRKNRQLERELQKKERH